MIAIKPATERGVHRDIDLLTDCDIVELLDRRQPGQADAGRAVAPRGHEGLSTRRHARIGRLADPQVTPVACPRREEAALVGDSGKRGCPETFLAGQCRELQECPSDAGCSVGKAGEWCDLLWQSPA